MDIAKLGFSADTRALKDAKASLDALVPSATKAEKATENFNNAAAGVTRGANGASAGIKSFQAAASGAATSTGNLTRAALSSGTAMGTVQRAAMGANTAVNALGLTTGRVDAAFVSAAARARQYETTLEQIAPAAAKAESSLNRLGAAANDNINRLQSTPGNVAAQFQDIGVTAAAGMSPMLIALQQGTQLSAAMSGGIGTLWAGVKQLLNPMSLLTIAVVALIAYLIQLGMEMLTAADNSDTLADSISSVQSTSYALSDAQGILGNVIDLTTGKINTQTSALIALARAQIVAGRIEAQRQQAAAREEMRSIRKGSVELQGGMAGGLKLVRTGDASSDIVSAFQEGSLSITEAERGLESMLRTGQITEESYLRAADAVTKFGVAVANEDVFKDAERMLNGDLSGNSYLLNPEKERKAGRAKVSEAEKLAEKYADIVRGAQASAEAMRVEAKALTMSGFAARGYRNEQELIAKALDAGITLTAAQAQELRDLASVLTDAEIAVEMQKITNAANDQLKALKDQGDLIGLTGLELEYQSARQKLVNEAIEANVIDVNNMTDATRQYVAVLGDLAMQQARQSTGNADASLLDKATKAHTERMIAVRRERGEIGLIGVALEKYRLDTELLIEAERGVASPETIERLREQGYEHITLSEAIRKQREEVEHYRETYRGFFSSMIDGLREGQSVWQAFGNAVMSVVNRIIDRLMTMDGGVLDKLVGLSGSLLGLGSKQSGLGNQSSFNNWMGGGQFDFDGMLGNATGNAFGPAGVEKFAQGGAFTNGIYTKPTLFKFASGGALGEMGEAGPEAVMPLKRGPNGSLGVELHRAQPVRVIVTTNDDRFDAYVDERAGSMDAQNAPAVASAGGQVGQARAAFTRSRTIGGR